MRARRVAFFKGSAWSFIAGNGFSSGSISSSYEIVQDCCCDNNCKGSRKFCSNTHGKQGNNLFQTPNILSTVFLVRIWDSLYLRSGCVCGSARGVIKYGRQG